MIALLLIFKEFIFKDAMIMIILVTGKKTAQKLHVTWSSLSAMRRF